LRLTAKGLYRWYASCCHTPLGNTVSPAIPFVGIVAHAFDSPDSTFGRPIAAIFGKYAIGAPPAGSTGRNLQLYGRASVMCGGWRVPGQAWPHPFFARTTGAPIYPLTTLSRLSA